MGYESPEECPISHLSTPPQRPSHLGGEYGAWFKDQRIVDAYHHRPPYSADAIRFLADLARDLPRVVLDVGCGTGDLARRLAPLVDRVDAVDFSEAMLAKGSSLPGGDHPHLRWIHGAAETAPISPPYALVTAGESLHWMDWDVVLPRFAESLAANGVLAVVGRGWDNPPVLAERQRPVFTRYSPVRDFQPYDLLAELERGGLFTRSGRRRFGPEDWRPTVEDFVECRHSQRGFSRTHMGEAAAAAFDEEIREILRDLVRSGDVRQNAGRLELSAETTVDWGVPHLRTVPGDPS